MESQSKYPKKVFFFACIPILWGIVMMAGWGLGVSKVHITGYEASGNAVHRALENAKQVSNEQYNMLYHQEDADTIPVEVMQLCLQTSELVHYMEYLRYELIQYANEETYELKCIENYKVDIPYISVSDIEGKDDFERSTAFMLHNGGPSNGEMLRNKFNEYLQSVRQLVPAEKRAEVDAKLSSFMLPPSETDRYGETISWEDSHFDHVITIAAATEIESLACDVMAVESIVLKSFMNQ